MKIRDQTLINYYVVVPSALRTNLQTAESLEIIFSSFPHICREVKPVFVHNFVFVSVFVTLSVTFCLCLRPGSHHPDSPITHSHCCYRSCLGLATGLFFFLHVGRWIISKQICFGGWISHKQAGLGKPLSIRCHLYLGIARLGGGSKPLPGWFGALF